MILFSFIIKPDLFDFETNKREDEIKRGIKPAQNFVYKPLNFTSSGNLKADILRISLEKRFDFKYVL